MLCNLRPTTARLWGGWIGAAAAILLALLSSTFTLAQASGDLRVAWRAAPTTEAEGTPWESPTRLDGPLLMGVPGAVLVVGNDDQGRLVRRHSLAADPSAPYCFAATDAAVVLFDRRKGLRRWDLSRDGRAVLRWRQVLQERATSLSWEGGDRIFVATWDQRILALAANDGKLLWSSEVDGKVDAPPRLVGGLVLIATKAQSLLALDAATGRARWRTPLPGPVIHPLAVHAIEARSVVLCAPWNGHLVAVEGQSGRVLWDKELPARVAGAPLVAGNSVVVPSENGRLLSFALDGTPAWETEGVAGEQTTLLLDASTAPARLLAVSQTIVAVAADTGRRIRDYPEGAAAELRQRFADAMIEGERTYSEAEKGALLAQGAFDVTGPVVGAARLAGPLLAFGTEEGWAYVFDRQTLHPLWRLHVGPPCSGPAASRGDQLFVAAGDEVFALDRRDGRRLWRRSVGAPLRTLAAGSLLGAVTPDRASLLSLETGAAVQTWRGRFVTLEHLTSADGTEGWLLVDDEGRIRRLSAGGQPVGSDMTLGGPLVGLTRGPAGKWIVARRDGAIAGFTESADGSFLVDWEQALGAPANLVRAASQKTLVQLRERLVCLDYAPGAPLWDLPSPAPDELLVAPGSDRPVELRLATISVRSLETGEAHITQNIDAPSVGAIIDSGGLIWWDRQGRCYRMDLGGGHVVLLVDLGESLERASAGEGGWIVTSSGGEVAWVEVVQPAPAAVTEGE